MASLCTHCGAPLSRPGAAFCAACGSAQSAGVGPPTVIGLPPLLPGAAGPPAPRLIIQEPGQPARNVPLNPGQTTIGRDAGNAIQIQNVAVSRHHALIDQRGAEHWVTDLGSTNGTSLNARRLQAQQSRKLAHNDIIRIGDQQGNSVGLTFCALPAAQAPGGTIRLGKLSLGNLPAYGIGRDPANQVHLDHPSVSRQHARVEQAAGGHIIRDLGSANGTFVNGQPVRGVRTLQVGEVIQIGPFKLVYDSSGLAQYAPGGNYRLDGLNLSREVTLGGSLSLARLLGTAVPARKLILNDVSISIYPKEFVALVGGSGAGKTTLMRALSGFVPADGRVFLNGDDLYANFAAYRSIMGYVPQDDIIHAQLTARSALTYAAKLRLPDATPQEIGQRVDDALAQVEMTEHADKQVNRLSGGQRKRVSIAVELLADPGLFFLDEPTSGLDPGLEKKMMYTMRQLADGGRTIVLVTHATANIAQCTQVAFMADGRLAYFGPPQEALTFFGATDFADIYTRLSQPLDPVKNPPPGWQPSSPPSPPTLTAAEAWETHFRGSKQYQQYVAGRLQGSGVVGGGARQFPPPSRQKISQFQQFGVLARRYFELIYRDALSLFVLLAVMPIIGMLLLLMAKPHDLVGKSPPTIRQEIQQEITDKRGRQDPSVNDERFQSSYSVSGSAQKLLFMLALAATLLGVFAAAYEIIKEEPIYQRERMVNLEILPYLGSKVSVLGGFALVQCFLLLLIMRLKVEFPSEGTLLPAAVEMYITLFLAALAGIGLGLLISATVRSSGMVIYVILLLLFVQIIFAGAIFDLPAVAKPISYLTTTRWTLEALGSTADMQRLKASEVTCIEFEDDRTRAMLGKADDPCAKGQMKQPFNYQFNVSFEHQAGHLIVRWVVLAGFAAAFIALAWFVQRRKDLV